VIPDPTPALVGALRAAGCVFAEDEAALLAAEALSAEHLAELVARRVAGEPLEQVLGWAEFRGLRVAVEPTVFVPRLRTGIVVAQAVALLRPGGVAVDLCCGVGAIGAAIAAEAPAGVEVYAADLDPVAVRCARRNLPPDRVFEGDLYDALPDSLRGRVDVLAVNAPYVPTDAIATMPPEARDHEARVALDGGADGLDVQRRVAAGAVEWLVPGGHLVIETSSSQAAYTVEAFERAGLDARVVTDDEIDGTVVVGRVVGRSPQPR